MYIFIMLGTYNSVTDENLHFEFIIFFTILSSAPSLKEIKIILYHIHTTDPCLKMYFFKSTVKE